MSHALDGAAGAFVAILALTLVNTFVRPVVSLLALPLNCLTLGLMRFVINALMLLLVAKLVSGFKISGFWTAFFASLFISLLSMALGALVPDAEMTIYRIPAAGQTISI